MNVGEWGGGPGTGPCSAAEALGTPELLEKCKARLRKAKPALSPGVPCPQFFLQVSPVPSTGSLFLFSAEKAAGTYSKKSEFLKKEVLGRKAAPGMGWEVPPIPHGSWTGLQSQLPDWEIPEESQNSSLCSQGIGDGFPGRATPGNTLQ